MYVMYVMYVCNVMLCNVMLCYVCMYVHYYNISMSIYGHIYIYTHTT